jgi:hypothetical protein
MKIHFYMPAIFSLVGLNTAPHGVYAQLNPPDRLPHDPTSQSRSSFVVGDEGIQTPSSATGAQHWPRRRAELLARHAHQTFRLAKGSQGTQMQQLPGLRYLKKGKESSPKSNAVEAKAAKKKQQLPSTGREKGIPAKSQRSENEGKENKQSITESFGIGAVVPSPRSQSVSTNSSDAGRRNNTNAPAKSVVSLESEVLLGKCLAAFRTVLNIENIALHRISHVPCDYHCGSRLKRTLL